MGLRGMHSLEIQISHVQHVSVKLCTVSVMRLHLAAQSPFIAADCLKKSLSGVAD